MAAIEKVLKQERELAIALYKVVHDQPLEGVWDRVFSGPYAEEDALQLARAIFHELGLRTAYEAVVESAIEDVRIEKMMAAQTPKAAEVVTKLRKEFAALPVDGLKGLRLLIDAAIEDKKG